MSNIESYVERLDHLEWACFKFENSILTYINPRNASEKICFNDVDQFTRLDIATAFCRDNNLDGVISREAIESFTYKSMLTLYHNHAWKSKTEKKYICDSIKILEEIINKTPNHNNCIDVIITNAVKQQEVADFLSVNFRGDIVADYPIDYLTSYRTRDQIPPTTTP